MRSERKIVTILFADITGSLTMIAGKDPERVDDILAELIETMGRAVRRFGGIVCQTMGDGVMALFGAPRAAEDHAVQACLAALAMRTALHGEASGRLSIRVGLNSGEVLVRGVRDDVTTRYGAVGEPVHVAARMEQSAEPDQILMTAETHRLAGGLIEARPLGSTPIKGLDGGHVVFELLRAAPRRAASRAPSQGGRMVGREAELAQMQLARDRAAVGQGRAMRLIGDAGCGKSRLLREFLADLRPAEWLVCQAEALPHRQTSYGAVTGMLTDLLGFKPDDSLDHRRFKLQARLEELGAPPGRFASPLASLLDLGVDDPGWHALEPWERRERTGQAASELFLRASRGPRCAALVIEDAHWLDDESANLFERLAAASAGERLLAIVTERAERNLKWTKAGGWTSAQGWTECHLRPLDEAASRRLLREHLLPGPGVAGLEERLVEHTGGNPLFIEECLYALAEGGELTRTENGKFRLEAPVTALRVPRSLRGLLDARVDRLSHADKDMLQAAAVVGTSVPVDLLHAVVHESGADLPEGTLRPALDRLCHHGFLHDERGDGTRYVFRHGLTREAVYNGILMRTRSRMHAGALAALEARPGAATDSADLLADHAFRAELWPKAVDHARVAGTRAAARDANGEALRAFEQALTAAARLPHGTDRDRVLLDLQIEARAPMFRLGDVAGLCAHVDEAILLAEQQDDYVRLGQCHLFGSHAMWLAGECTAALALARKAGDLGTARSDRDLAMRARFQEGLVQLSQGRAGETIAGMRDVLAHITGASQAPGRYGLDEALAVTALGYLARAAADAGDFVTAEGAIADARNRAQRLDRRFSWIFVETAEGYLLLMQGRAAQAVDPLHRAVATCRAADARLLGPIPGAMLARALIETGEPTAALPLAQQAVTDAARMGFLTSQPMRLAILAQVQLATGAMEEARARAEEALALARRQGEGGAEAYTLSRLAPVLPDPRLALATAHEIATTLGLRPLAARCAEAQGRP